MPYPDPARPTVASSANADVNVVTACPFCRSARVTTASKTISENTYWRCVGCGEIWNPSRAGARRAITNWR